MHSHITVLIDSSAESLSTPLKEALERHRLDEDSLESIRAHHWDYWYCATSDPLNDPEIQGRFASERAEILNHSAFVRNLPASFETSGIIDLEGSWVDLQDFGWRMTDEPSASNDTAMREWNSGLREILDRHPDAIAIQVIVHS